MADLSPLKGMSSLTYLMCFDTKVSDLSPLQDCKNLRKLDVTDTQVTSGGAVDLQKALPNCEIEWGEKKGAADSDTPPVVKPLAPK